MVFGNLGNMGEMMKMAREMQGQMKKVKDELSKEIFEGTSRGVTATVSGDMEFKDIKIETQMIDPNKAGELEKQVREAVKKALKEAKDGAAKKMKSVTGGLGLPGMF